MINRVFLVGRVGRDPEIRVTRSGDCVATVSLATSERWSKDGQKHERTEWHRVESWGTTAKFVRDYVTKGALLGVEGSIRTEEYTSAKGEPRKATKIKAARIDLIAGSKAHADTDPAPEPDDVTDEPF